MLRERKYFIGYKHGKIKHFTFPYSLHHFNFAYDNGYKTADVIETGLIQDNRIIILSCVNQKHLQRRDYLRQIPINTLKAREVESRYSYAYAGLREGD